VPLEDVALASGLLVHRHEQTLGEGRRSFPGKANSALT
jgi:hypothetical protein